MKYTKELLESIVKAVYSFSDIARELGLKPHSGNIRTIHSKLDEFKLDYSHFKGHAWNKGGTNPNSKKQDLTEVLVKNSSYKNTNSLRNRLIKEGFKPSKCEICGVDEWLGNPISLQLHHIDGDKTNNELNNLQVLCPNCHSQTDNYGSKNIK